MKKILLVPLLLSLTACANTGTSSRDMMDYQNTFITSYLDGYLKTLPKVIIAR